MRDYNFVTPIVMSCIPEEIKELMEPLKKMGYDGCNYRISDDYYNKASENHAKGLEALGLIV